MAATTIYGMQIAGNVLPIQDKRIGDVPKDASGKDQTVIAYIDSKGSSSVDWEDNDIDFNTEL